MQFSRFSEVEVRSFVTGAEGLQQFKQAIDAMAVVPAQNFLRSGPFRRPLWPCCNSRSAPSSHRSCMSRSARPYPWISDR